MIRHWFLPALLTCTLIPAAFADETISWPLPPAPQGVNTAITAAPRLDWLQRVQQNFDRAKKVTAPIELIFDGDSITDGWQGGGREIWAQHYAPLNAFDFGISGDRTEHILWRLDHGQVEGMHPKMIAIMIGTNNGSNTAEQVAEGIKAVVAGYQQRCPEAVILLQGVFPRGEKATEPVRAKIQKINELIAPLGDGKKVIYVDFGAKFLEPDGTMSKEIMPDFLHPSPKGYQIWADAIQPVIEKIFPSAPKPQQPVAKASTN